MLGALAAGTGLETLINIFVRSILPQTKHNLTKLCKSLIENAENKNKSLHRGNGKMKDCRNFGQWNRGHGKMYQSKSYVNIGLYTLLTYRRQNKSSI